MSYSLAMRLYQSLKPEAHGKIDPYSGQSFCHLSYWHKRLKEVQGHAEAQIGGMNCAAFMFDKEGKCRSLINKNCFGGITGKDMDYIIFPFFNAKDYSYLDYIINRSPFKGISLSTIDNIKEDGFIICSTDHPANVLIGFGMLVRQYWEQITPVKMFNLYVKNGASEDEAFILAQQTDIDNSGTLYYSLARHTAFCEGGLSSKRGVKNYLNGNIVSKTGIFGKGYSYTGVDKMFGDSSYYNDYLNIGLTLDMSYEKEEAKEVKINPFAQSKKVRKTDIKLFLKNMNLGKYK